MLLALDVGGTHVRAAAVDEHGQILQEERLHAGLSRLQADSREKVQNEVLDRLVAAVNPIRRRHEHIRAVGIGFPGFFLGGSGRLAASPNLPLLNDFDLGGQLAERLRLPVAVQNDALAAAIGEFRFGVGQGLSHLLHVTLGTGVGGGLILDGHPYAGEGGMAMEIGHVGVVPDGRLCGCGNRGCLEAYASASSVAARFGEQGGMGAATAAGVHRLAQQGDRLAREILAQAGSYLGRGLAAAVNILDVNHISFSGGLVGAWEYMEASLRTAMDDGLIPPLKGRVHLRVTALGDHAGLLGATALASDAVGGRGVRG